MSVLTLNALDTRLSTLLPVAQHRVVLLCLPACVTPAKSLADTSASYLPLQFSDIQISLYHLSTNKLIGSGSFGHHTVKKGSAVPVQLPINVTYSAINTSDTTWSDWYNACGHIWAGTNRPSLSVKMVVKSSIVGLVTRPETGSQVGDVACPFELPSNSV